MHIVPLRLILLKVCLFERLNEINYRVCGEIHARATLFNQNITFFLSFFFIEGKDSYFDLIKYLTRKKEKKGRGQRDYINLINLSLSFS